VSQPDVAVIGGGPAGMMAAGRAAELGASVLLIEKNSALGRKLLITGGGRCNVTNAEPDARTLASHYGTAKHALLSPFSKLSSSDVLEWFASYGMPTKIEDHQRAFPADDKAASVLNVLERYLRKGQVKLALNREVLGMTVENGRIAGVRTRQGTLSAGHYVLATGGTSHPETGSTGDGFQWLADLGLRVRFPEPSLVPIAVREPWVAELAGLSFAEAGLAAWVNGQRLEYRTGKLLITHFGLSGPLVLNFATALSRLRSQTSRQGELSLFIDLFPASDARTLDRDLVAKFSEQPGKKLKNALRSLVPPRLVPRLLLQSRADGEKSLAQVTRGERESLGETLKGFSLTFKRLMDETRAVVSSGGLHLDEIDWRTMTCKALPNLAVVGDLIDINRPSGGYSLQLCWSTGWVAGGSFS
jgi:predicted Rossmann fold flavoprotein